MNMNFGANKIPSETLILETLLLVLMVNGTGKKVVERT